MVGICLTLPAQPSLAQRASFPQPRLVNNQAAPVAAGLIGVVADDAGRPLAGAVVSAIGTESAFAVSGPDGRFAFRTLPRGPYIVRAHLQGYLPARGRLMQVTTTSARGPFTITLVKRSESIDTPAVLAAGVGPVDDALASEPESDGNAHEHDELAWRLRHLKRSVLKDADQMVAGLAGDTGIEESTWWGLGRAVSGPARLASSLLAELPLAGQFNILTSTSFDRPQDLFSPDVVMPRGVALVSLAAPAASGEWRVRGAMTQGDLSSWIVAGSFVRRVKAAHAYEAGVSYAMQRYAGGNAEALAAMRDGSRTVGALYAFDSWTVVPQLRVHYGAKYANYGYLKDESLLSPRAGVELKPWADDSLRVRASVARSETAPGAEEFLPPAAGVWLPPERTFSSVSRTGFAPERIDHLEVAASREVAGGLLVDVRAFRQRGEDQVVTLFGPLTTGGEVRTGHYMVGSAGDFDAAGWGVNVSRSVGEGTRASIDYSLVGADWTRRSADGDALAVLAGQVLRTADRVHDLTATVESTVAPTATRVFVLYRINTAMSVAPGVDQGAAGARRFDVQVNQALPFLAFTNARWEALVAVKNVFHDELTGSGSVYDELLVVRAPTRVLGGVTVKF